MFVSYVDLEIEISEEFYSFNFQCVFFLHCSLNLATLFGLIKHDVYINYMLLLNQLFPT
jgi:hypothetical protein